MRTIEPNEHTTLEAMDLPMLVNNGASWDAPPIKHFLNTTKPLREATLSSSNSVAKALVYAHPAMPRLGPGGTVPKARDVLAINGPAVLSMGRHVESSKRPAAFMYGQGWQGFVWDSAAEQVKQACLRCIRNHKVTPTPAENYIPRYAPSRQSTRAHATAQPPAVANRQPAVGAPTTPSAPAAPDATRRGRARARRPSAETT